MNVAAQGSDSTLPRSLLIGAGEYRCDGKEDFVFADRLLSSRDHMHEVCQNVNLLSETRLLTDFGDSIECVAHDRNQHIQEDDLGKNCRNDENN